MRGEVVLLSRNVRIIGNDSDSWGGQIVVSDSLEMDGTFREAQLMMDNVELYNCSQRNTQKAAIRFELTSTKWHSVTNTVIWGGDAWGISVVDSANVYMDKTTVLMGR